MLDTGPPIVRWDKKEKLQFHMLDSSKTIGLKVILHREV